MSIIFIMFLKIKHNIDKFMQTFTENLTLTPVIQAKNQNLNEIFKIYSQKK